MRLTTHTPSNVNIVASACVTLFAFAGMSRGAGGLTGAMSRLQCLVAAKADVEFEKHEERSCGGQTHLKPLVVIESCVGMGTACETCANLSNQT